MFDGGDELANQAGGGERPRATEPSPRTHPTVRVAAPAPKGPTVNLFRVRVEWGTMAVLDRETLLDLVVNVVPLGIILLFAVVGLVVAPLGYADLLTELVELGLLAVPFVVLAVVSYIAGRAVMLDEERVAAETSEPPGTVERYPDDGTFETEHADREAEHAEVEADVEADSEAERTDGETGRAGVADDTEKTDPVVEREADEEP